MASTYPDLDARLGTIVKYLPQMREMGVSRLTIDGIEVEMRGMPQAQAAEPAPMLNVGRDPLTMGLPTGMKVPSLRDRHG